MIVTLTLNPAFDVHCRAKSLALDRENIAEVSSRIPGGKGINLSRALCAAGTENRAVCLLGSENADEFCRSLSLDLIKITVPGRIRENITIHTENGRETRISFRGFSCDDAVCDRLFELPLKDGDILTLTGRLSDGMSLEKIKKMLIFYAEKGVKTVIDSKSFALSDIIECKPFMIKPNEEEMAEYFGDCDARQKARELVSLGVCNVMLSEGARGATLFCEEGTFRAVPPEIKAISTVGAGDSSIAGFLSAYIAGKSKLVCLKTAVAFGTAACLTEGTEPPRLSDINAILPRITEG